MARVGEMKALDEIKARYKATTSGDWRYVNEIDPDPIFLKTWGPNYKTMHFVQCGSENDAYTLRNITPKRTMMMEGDAKFCAHAHQDIPRLVRALEVAIECLTEHSIVSYRMEAKEEIERILNGEPE